MVFGIFLLVIIFLLYQLFVKGLLLKIILFCAGCFGLYVALKLYISGANQTAFSLANGASFSWAFVVPTVVCILCLLCSKTDQ
jgi:hypothetical protein